MSEPKTDIWMPLAIGDYLADTSHLSTIEHGAYLLLLMHYWRKGPLPNDLGKIAQIAKLNPDAWSIAQALLGEFFTLEEDGLYHQKRSDIEKAKWQGKKQKAKEKAVIAANKRWGKDAPSNASGNAPSNAQAMLGACPSPSPLPIKTVSDAKASSPRRDADGGKQEPDPEELIYQEYPRKEGHGAAIKAIEKSVERIRKGEGVIPAMSDKREARVYLYKRVQTYARSPAGSRADKTLIPHPATWFNQSRYLDDDANWQLTGVQANGANQSNRGAAVGRVARSLGEWDRAFADRDRDRAVSASVPTNAGVLPAPGVRG